MRHYGKLGDLPLDRDLDTVFENYPIPESEVVGG
jgi:hypothetical protein